MAESTADRVRRVRPFSVEGSLARVTGHELELRGLRLSVGDTITVATADGDRPGEVVALGSDGARALILGESAGLARGDRVRLRDGGVTAVVSPALVGRVIDGLGRPLDGGPPIVGEAVPLDASIPSPLARRRITEPLPVGVRLIDTLATAGRGQRVGVFAGSGVGKSTLLGMMARGTAADVNVVALIGERGREVREFIEDDLGAEGMARTVVVVATSDQPPLVRLRAGFLATRIAEWFADGGVDVLLLLDSLTRLAMAQRDVGLAAGEPPTSRGYTPSVFTLLPRLLERAGPREHGTITGFYTVLVEGDDMNDPIADSARSILDGHLVLDRRLTTIGRYPPIDPLASLSRLASKVITPEQQAAATALRTVLAAAEEVRDLVEVGAYVRGTNPTADRGLALQGELHAFLSQHMSERCSYEDAWRAATALAALATGTGEEGDGG
ncbi:MAG TPA: FliI/YscN family ATPase [Egibacteraceae bacterium]